MKYPWLDSYCLSKKAAEKEYKPEWDAFRYTVKGKLFAMLGGDKENKPIFTLKLDPIYGFALREQYSFIVPGYYMDKEHWNSLYLDGDVPDEVVKHMIDNAYEVVLKSLSKKLLKEIMDATSQDEASISNV